MINKEFGLLFDMDGVIVDSNPCHKRCIKVFCERYDKQVTDTFLEQKVYGRTNNEWIPEIFGKLPQDQIDALADEKEAMFREMFQSELIPIEGLIPFLETCKEARIPMAVGTSAPLANATFILEGLEIKNFFQDILHSADVTIGKPHPEIYLKAASRLSLSPDKCIVLEDSIAGIQAGQSANCKVIGITSTHSKEEFSECDLIIDNFKTLRVEHLLDII